MPSIRERIEARTEIRGPDECWLWTGGVGSTGTATMQIEKQSRSVRRVLWELDHGPVDGRALIMTTCNEKLCLNPAHLYLKSLHLHDLLWQSVVKTEACWNYTGSKDHNGYGHIFHLGKHYRAHRLSWEIHFGPIEGHVPGHPELEICVLHRCDNPACVRPDHLFLGHDADNHADMVAKGRHAHGPALSKALRESLAKRGPKLRKLTPTTIEAIRLAKAGGQVAREIAETYGVGMSTVYAVTSGRRAEQCLPNDSSLPSSDSEGTKR